MHCPRTSLLVQNSPDFLADFLLRQPAGHILGPFLTNSYEPRVYGQPDLPYGSHGSPLKPAVSRYSPCPLPPPQFSSKFPLHNPRTTRDLTPPPTTISRNFEQAFIPISTSTTNFPPHDERTSGIVALSRHPSPFSGNVEEPKTKTRILISRCRKL